MLLALLEFTYNIEYFRFRDSRSVVELLCASAVIRFVFILSSRPVDGLIYTKFSSFSPRVLPICEQEARAHAAEVVAGLWNVLPSMAVEIATTTRPEFVQAEDYLKIGRVTLPKMPQVT